MSLPQRGRVSLALLLVVFGLGSGRVSSWASVGSGSRLQSASTRTEPQGTASAPDLEEARRLVAEGRFGEAEAVLEAVVGESPGSARAWALLGRARALDRRYRAAEEPLRRAVELGADDLRTLLMLGSTLWENGLLDEAERVLEKATRIEGDGLPAEYQLASLWLWQGRFSEALPILERVVRERPEWTGARLDLARAYQGVGDLEAAQAAFESYLRRVPRDAGARYGLAMVLRARGDVERAGEEMAKATEVRESDRDALLREGQLEARVAQVAHLLREGNDEEALDLLEGLPRSADVLELSARALLARGDVHGAIERLEEALSLDPARRDLRTRLQELYAVAREDG